MRSILLAALLALGLTLSAASRAQEHPSGDVALTYHWVRSNAAPGDCGCFSLNGGSVSGSWDFRGPLSLVTEIAAEHADNVNSTGRSLTLTSYLAGARFYFPRSWRRDDHHPQPFAQLLLGGAHAGGTVAGRADGSFAFAARLGGGLDLPIRSHFVLRLIQLDYDVTTFSNSQNTHQNNLLVGAGIAFRWASKRE